MRKITGFRRIAVRGRSWTDRSGRLWQIRYPFPEPSLVSLGKVHHLFHGLMVARAMQALSPRAGPSTNRPVSHQHTQWLCLCFWKRGRLPSASLWGKVGSRLSEHWVEAGLITRETRAQILPLPLSCVSSGKPWTSLSFTSKCLRP